MSNVSIARPTQKKIVPSFMVRKLDGEVTREIIGKDAKGSRTTKEVKVPAGYLVSFPTKGHSIRVRDDASLKRLGFDQTIPLVDASSDDDDIVGEMPNSVLAGSRG